VLIRRRGDIAAAPFALRIAYGEKEGNRMSVYFMSRPTATLAAALPRSLAIPIVLLLLLLAGRPALANVAPAFSGTPAISGTAKVGLTLSLTGTDATDADGDSVIYGYVWQANGTTIPAATNPTLVLAAAQAHASITCAVTASDGVGGSTTLTTAAVTVLNTAPVFTGTPAIVGMSGLGNLLSLKNTDTFDADGDTVTLTYQWRRNGGIIIGATGSTYLQTYSSKDNSFTCTLTATDAYGGSRVFTTASARTSNYAPTITGTPVISGTPQVGLTLGVTGFTVTDNDGDPWTLAYQWYANNVAIAGATNATFTLTTAQPRGTSIHCVLKASDPYVTGSPRGTVAVIVVNAPPYFSQASEITGTLRVGQTLGVGFYPADIDGDVTTATAFQWYANGVAIAGATTASLTLTAAQAHAVITYDITISDGALSATDTSSPVTVGNSAPFFNGAPTITGTPREGLTLGLNVLTHDVDGDTVTLAYQWNADGVPVAGATGATWVIPAGLATHAALTCTLTVSDAYGGSTTTTTAAKERNAAPVFTGTPTITGVALEGLTLGLADTGVADADGDTVTLTYQWKRGTATISSATGATYQVNSKQHVDYTCVITASDGHGGVTIFTTQAARNTNADPYFNGMPAISGTAKVGLTVSLTGTATTDLDGDPVTLTYQWLKNGLTIAGATNETFTITAAQAHSSISCRITASDPYTGSVNRLTGQVVVANTAPSFTGLPAIDGVPMVGQTLGLIDADTGDVDGDTFTTAYQWYADGAPIEGAITATLVPTAAQAHALLTCTITLSDTYGGTTSCTTEGLPMANTAPAFASTPAIDGTPYVGQPIGLTDIGAIDADDDAVTYTYQWYVLTSPLAGATSATYTPTTFVAHKSLSCKVTISDGVNATTYTTAAVTVGNTAPTFTGTPTISGTPKVGEFLTVTNIGSTDVDADTVTTTYQWQRNGVNIGVTGSTFLITPAFAHTSLSCIVTITDNCGGATSVTTAAVAVQNAKPTFTGTPMLTGTAKLGYSLTVSGQDTSDPDYDTVTLTYNWYYGSALVTSGTNASLTLTTAHKHGSISCNVVASDGHGGTISYTTAAVAVLNTNPVFSPLPGFIMGTRIVGGTLNRPTFGTADAEGDTVTASSQWYANGVAIPGATGATLSITAAQAHADITCVITLTDGYGGSRSYTSETVAILNSTPVCTGTPAINGTLRVGQTLNLIGYTLSDADNDTLTSQYQWKADGVAIAGATDATFVVTAAQLHANITCTLTVTDGYGGSVIRTTAAVLINTAPVFTGTPAITGTPAVGLTLSLTGVSATDGDDEPVTFTYQWYANAAAIAGATLATFPITAAQAHTSLMCKVTATDGCQNITRDTASVAVYNTFPSFTTGAVIAGDGHVGTTICVTPSLVDPDNDTLTKTYQWKADGVNILGATAASFTLTGVQAHTTITCLVSVSDGFGGVASDLTDPFAVLNTAPYFYGTPTIVGDPRVGQPLTVGDTSASDVDFDLITKHYQWYAGGIAITGATGESYTLIATQPRGTSITCTVTGDDGYGGSVDFTTAAVTVLNNAPVFPDAPAITGTPRVGQALSLSNAIATDVDDDTVTLAYQWHANGTPIAGATGAAYTLTAAQNHAHITCAITATDGNGGSTVATTAAVTVQNTAPTFTGTPTIASTPKIGVSLGLTIPGTADAEGDTVTLSYQWNAGGTAIAGATSATFVPTMAQAHGDLTCTITATDPYSGSTSVTTAARTVENTVPAFIGTPAITGGPWVDTTQGVSGIPTTDADGDAVTATYQWYTNGVPAATTPTFTITKAITRGTLITCVVHIADPYGATNVYTTAGVTVLNSVPRFVQAPFILGAAKPFQLLTLGGIDVMDPDGDAVTLTYQWRGSATPIPGATDYVYQVTGTPYGNYLCLITATDSFGGSSTIGTQLVTTNDSAPTFTGTPSITGTPAVNLTLSLMNTTTNDAANHPVTLHYQWFANGVSIFGATRSTFVITPAQAHATITCTLYAVDSQGAASAFTTAGVTVLNSAPSFTSGPTMNGDRHVGEAMNVTGTAVDPDGDAVTIIYNWFYFTPNRVTLSTTANATIPVAAAHKQIQCDVKPIDPPYSTNNVVSSLAFTVLNSAPTGLAFSATTLPDGLAVGGAVGTFSASDLDADTLTYTLVAGDGDTDNATFTIVGATLQANRVIDYDAQASYTIRVRVSDGYGGTLEAAYTLNVLGLPRVTTPTATGITTAGATLGATISASGNSAITGAGVTYGLTADPIVEGTKVATAATSDAFTVAVAGLASNTLYHYRGYATNSTGTGYAPDATVVTRPDAPTGLLASGVTESGCTLTWQAVSGTASVTYVVETATAADFTGATAQPATAATSLTLTELTADTTYYVRVTAVNATGSGVASAPLTVTTRKVRTLTITNPIAATHWQAGTSVTVAWQATGDVVSPLHLTVRCNDADVSAADVPLADGSATVMLPDDIGGSATVTLDDGAGIIATATVPITPCAFTLTAPAGGEAWSIGTTHTIGWTYTGTPDTVTLELWRPNATGTLVLAEILADGISAGAGGIGSYAWTITVTTPLGARNVVCIRHAGPSALATGAAVSREFAITANKSHQPDLWMRLATESSYTGSNVYSQNGASHTKAQTIPRTSKAFYYLYLENDGNQADSYTITATGLPAGWTAKLTNAANAELANFTTSGAVVSTVAAGTKVFLQVTVQPGATLTGGSLCPLTVTAVSQGNGLMKDVAVLSTTLAVTHRPDLTLRLPSEASYIGNDLYSLDGSGQKRACAGERTVAQNFYLRLQNDGSQAESFTLKVTAPPTGWTVKVISGLHGTVTTAAVSAAGATIGPLAIDGSDFISITATPQATLPSGATFPITVTVQPVGLDAPRDVAECTAHIYARQPDLWVRTLADSGYTGDNLITATGAGQARAVTTTSAAAVYYVRVQNDGDTTDTLKVALSTVPAGWSVTAYDDTNTVLPGFTTSGATFTGVAPGASGFIMLAVTPSAGLASDAVCPLTVTATSGAEPTQLDIALLTTTKVDVHQPDLMLRLPTEPTYYGAGLYTALGAVQARAQTVPLATTATYYLYLANAGTVTDTFTLTGPTVPAGWRVRLFVGGVDQSAAVCGGGGLAVGPLAPGAKVLVQVNVSELTRTAPGDVFTLPLTATAGGVDETAVLTTTCN
jgi:uncharacterized membrane protein